MYKANVRRLPATPWRLALGGAALAASALLLQNLLGRIGTDDVPADPLLDTPKPFAEAVWIIDSKLPGRMGRILPVRMTVIRLPDGGLLLHSPTRFSPTLRQALEEFGPIRHLVAPNVAHWIFLRDWQEACPDAVTWGAPNLDKRRQVRKTDLRIDRVLSEGATPEWGDAIELVIVPGAIGFREVAFSHRASRTLVLTDLMMDLDPAHLPLPIRSLVLTAGMTAPDRMPPPYLRLAVRAGGKSARHAGKRLVALRPNGSCSRMDARWRRMAPACSQGRSGGSPARTDRRT